MFRAILVPHDGSPLAEVAVPYATAIARSAHGRLIVIQAARDPVSKRHAELELAVLAERLWKSGIAVETHVRDADDANDAGDFIVGAVPAWEADLVVMSTHGRSGLGRWLYGSVADHVLRHADVPIFLIPASCDQTWPPNPDGSHILVALDGSEFAEEALRPARDLASTLGASLLLVRAVPPPTVPGGYGQAVPYIPSDSGAALEEARAYLKGVASSLRATSTGPVDVDVHAEVGTPVMALVSVAQHRQVMAIAMATHGRSGIARVVLGSVATGVLQQAGIPLLLVRPAAMRAAADGRPTTDDR
jgi:nucleotide-binding universal stress UspA family protein